MSAPKNLPPDANARRRAILDHNTTLLVEAGAGTGKTALMAGRIALLVAGGVAPRDVVAITFTEAASSELRERIERYVTQLAISVIPKELDVAVMGGLLPEQLANVKVAVSTLDELTCTTIHGFCQQIVRAYPVEASIDPGAVIIDPDAADLAYDDLLFAWLSARFGRDRSKEGLGRLPPVPEKGEDDFFAELMIDDPDGIVEIVRQTAQFLRGKRAIGAPAGELDKAVLENLAKATAAFKAWYAGCKIEEEKTAGLIEGLASFGSTLAEAAAAPLTGRALARLLLHDAPKCVHSSEPRFSKWGNKGKWIDAAKAAGKGKPHGEQLNNEASQHYDTCSGLYRTFVESVAGAAITRFIKEFEPLTQLYDDYKRQAALLDFDDLLHHARDLLACNDTVRRDLGKRYSRILVDEFQDTDPLQAEILWLLCGEGDSKQDWTQRKLRPGSLFSVGDPKQAIYRFRGADVDTYLRAKAALLEQSPDSVIHITSNFRSVEPIITFANARFAPLLTEEKGQPGFKELAAMRSAAGTLRHVAAIDVPIGDDQKPDGKLKVELLRRAEAVKVAETIVSVIGRLKVWDRGIQEERSCRAGDIALLAPTGTGLWIYERELENRGLPIASQAGKSFYTRQEVQDLIAVVRAVADRRDTLALGAFLRGPLVGLTEEQIADAILALPGVDSGRIPSLYLWTNIEAIANPLLKRPLQVLQNLGRKARRTTPYHLLAEAIEELNVRSILRDRYRQGSERALANIEMLLEMARAYEARGIAAFAEALKASWNDTERHIEGRPDADADAVSIITMHSAKGLEWPVVIPINSTTQVEDKLAFVHRRSDNTVHFKLLDCVGPDYEIVKADERAQASRERVRLWYVALTRACDLLLIPRLSERTAADWFSLLGTDFKDLPSFDAAGLGEPAAAPSAASVANDQDEVRWKEEATKIGALKRMIVWRSPSLHERGGDVSAAELVARDAVALTASIPAEAHTREELQPKIKGSRERGLVIHKLFEEVLTGETAENGKALEDRARDLLTELGLEEAMAPDAGPHAPEMVASVLRTFELEEIKALRPRLVPEATVFSASTDGSTTSYVGGVADAVAVNGDGTIDAVVDWKSDVDPDGATITFYREQVREYQKATGAKAGLLVFVTSGRVEVIS